MQRDRYDMVARRHRRIATTGLGMVVALLVALLIAAGCSGDDEGSSATTAAATSAVATTAAPATTIASTTTSAASTAAPTTVAPSTSAAVPATTAAPATACDQGASLPSVAGQPVAGSASDVDITSFDGTVIRGHWFPAAGDVPAPTILNGPGFGSSGDVDLGPQAPSSSTPSISTLNDAGYNVLTWDPRGIGESGGLVSLDGPDLEGRDAQALLDWVAEQPESLLDKPGDPRAGMVGGSYGGGIQLTLASIDCRVEAIAPAIAWNSLLTSLYPNDTIKAGWTGLLDFASAAADRDPRVESAMAAARADGVLDPAAIDWFASRGVGERIADVTTPALFLQGTVDTLFPLDEAVTNYRSLRDRDVPTRLLWFCGGHGLCLTNTDDAARVRDATMAWLARYVSGDETVTTGAAFDIVDDDGLVYTADDFPEAPTGYLEATGEGSLDLTAEGGSGPATAPGGDPLQSAVAGITAAAASNAATVDIVAGADTLVVGAPLLRLEYVGTPGEGAAPTRVFAQLVDVARGVVVGNQVTPIDVVLDGETQTIDLPMEMIAQSMAAGETLQLQLTPTAVEFTVPQLGGHVEFASIGIRLPTASLLESDR